MKLLDKLKNALFEEEIVEIEEKPSKKDLKREKKEHIRVQREKKKEDKKPIAKKIVQIKEEEEEIEDSQREGHIGESLAVDEELINDNTGKKEFKFPMVSDNEFIDKRENRRLKRDNTVNEFEKDAEKKELPPKEEIINTDTEIYNEDKDKYLISDVERKPYNVDDLGILVGEKGLYEKKDERGYFKPSPIISPIYGILDKNYTKDDITPKKEIRLTSSYSRENINVDDIRKKAFGRADEYEEDISGIEEDNSDDNILVDLSNDDTPEVNRVTVGDAEEYFDDLGLEYNVDYKDASKKPITKRRTKIEYHDDLEEDILEEVEEKNKENEPVKETIIDSNNDNDDDSEDNLFDLIDSMYDKE